MKKTEDMNEQEKWWKIEGYDSAEEYHFDQWLNELSELGFINSVKRQEEFIVSNPVLVSHLIVLKTKNKVESKTILDGCKYTADYVVEFEERFLNWLRVNGIACDVNDSLWVNKYPPIVLTSELWIVDVKGDGDPFHDEKYFSMIRKFVYATQSIFVDKQVVTTKSYKQHSSKRSLFESTFTPMSYQRTDISKSKRKLHYPAVSVADWVGAF